LELAISDPDLVDAIDLLNAQHVAIEALKRINHARSFGHDWATMPLPSESRD
ncbi:unnamed protein product, partial [marine sediment metagenome]